MAQRRRVALETEPHVYEVDLGPDRGGVKELRFRPEVLGTEFVDAQQDLVDVRNEVNDLEDKRKANALANAAMYRYLAGFMLPESAAELADFDDEGNLVEKRLELPDWVLADMSTWVVEVYGRRDPTGSQPDSAHSHSPPGKPSTGGGRSPASTRKRGR